MTDYKLEIDRLRQKVAQQRRCITVLYILWGVVIGATIIFTIFG